MSRLIDADNLNFEGQNYNKSQMKAILDFIDKQPTAYNVGKVVKPLEEVLAIEFEAFGMCADYVELTHAKALVKAGGINE